MDMWADPASTHGPATKPPAQAPGISCSNLSRMAVAHGQTVHVCALFCLFEIFDMFPSQNDNKVSPEAREAVPDGRPWTQCA